MKRITTQVRAAMTFLFMTAVALVMLVVGILTLFRARRFYSEVMARWLGAMHLESSPILDELAAVDRVVSGHQVRRAVGGPPFLHEEAH